MSEFAILTDSSADLGADMVRELDVMVLPLSFTLDGKTLQDWPDQRDMDLKTFYDRERAGAFATTSAVNVEQYVQLLEPVLKQGKDVLVLAFSSGLSSTCNSAKIAGDELREMFPNRKIYVVDTLCASLGQGLLVYLCAKEREKGCTIEEVRDFAQANVQKISHQFTVDDLHTLKRGGRISAATAVVGTMLQIKPVLHVDENGKLVAVSKARGRKAALRALVDTMEKTVIEPKDQIVFLSHSDCLEDAQWVADNIKERLGITRFYFNYIGPVIGAHTGPGTVALFYRGTR